MTTQPCNRNCCLDLFDVCLGCGRHLEEITGWHSADESERLKIVERAGQRLTERQRMYVKRPVVIRSE
jgi:predicted Fe-S protein YdhL (DUF1289 family)